jgi:hypothetical protein
MWPSLSVANSVADWANIFFIGSLVVGVVSTILIVWMANVKEGYWERARLESDERIASLVTQGDQLRKDTAEATERVVKAQLDLEKYKAPRTLTNDGAYRVAEKMKPYAGTRYDLSVPVNIEPGCDLTVAVPFSLDKAGWQGIEIPGAATPMNSLTSPSTGIGTTLGVFGVAIGIDAVDVSYNSVELAKHLASALNDEGIDAFVDTIGARPTGPIIPTPATNPIIHVRIGNKP